MAYRHMGYGLGDVDADIGVDGTESISITELETGNEIWGWAFLLAIDCLIESSISGLNREEF